MKQKIALITVSVLLAVSVGLGMGLGIPAATGKRQAEEEYVRLRESILSWQYTYFRRFSVFSSKTETGDGSLPGLLDENGVVSKDRVYHHFLGRITERMESNGSLVYDSVVIANHEGEDGDKWRFFNPDYMGGSLADLANCLSRSIEAIPFEADGTCKPQGDVLLMVEKTQQLIDLFANAYRQSFQSAASKYPDPNIMDFNYYLYFRDYLIPALDEQEEERIQLIEEIYTLVEQLRED